MPVRSASLLLAFVILFSALMQAEGRALKGFSVRANGLLVPSTAPQSAMPPGAPYRSLRSENGMYECRYAYRSSGTVRDLGVYRGGSLLYTLAETGAHSLKISNQGYLLLTRIVQGSRYQLEFNIRTVSGQEVFLKSYPGPETSGFSRMGMHFGVCTGDYLEVVHLASGYTRRYRTGRKFDISDDGTVVAVSYAGGASMYVAGRLVKELKTGFVFNRGIRISPDNRHLAIAGIRALQVYDIPGAGLLHTHRLGPRESIRNIRMDNATLWAGIKYEDRELRKGLLNTYALDKGPFFLNTTQKSAEPVKKSGFDVDLFKTSSGERAWKTGREPIPWPFLPQDTPHKLWNAYECLNTDVDGRINADWGYPYLHQGVDMEVDSNEACYSIDTGIVKYLGDMGGSGELYWRLAVSRDRSTGPTDSWMYAHLVENSINYDEGDYIHSVGLHLADIVPWYNNVDAHLHFVQIRDHGAVYSFSDDEWGINFNPTLVLTPNPDKTPPVIVEGIDGKSRLAYCPNGSGYGTREDDYFFPDSARGGVSDDIDIVVNLYDYANYENFTQPAYETFYWIMGIDPVNAWSNYGRLVVDTTLALRRNNAYSFYAAGSFMPYAEIMYKSDSVFVVGGWFNRTRTFAHYLTNNNGDTLTELGEEDSCLHTAEYFDGWYRVFVKACDEAGNCAVDSEDVYFNNANPDTTEPVAPVAAGPDPEFGIKTSVSGPSGTVTINYGLTSAGPVALRVYDVSGNPVRTLVRGKQAAGFYRKQWDGADASGRPAGPGMYICRLESGGLAAAGKVALGR